MSHPVIAPLCFFLPFMILCPPYFFSTIDRTEVGGVIVPISASTR
ncbi:protein of unknown function [Candidatus Nitrospira inopinata]|uniref:Uncharacterized protein n=1 Tax=Candidatus Nitrospira inopinata TaxID=1715989 RepID=A0A0S4L023_9BACT|nr:protein of unknown function [Candidatus Nitrospira inopinata]